MSRRGASTHKPFRGSGASLGESLRWSSSPTSLVPDGFSLTRASGGTYFDSAGLLQTASTDVARGTYRWNGSAWVFDGTINEAAATNLRLRSNALSTAPWDVTNIDGIVQNVTGPLGANTAWTLTDSNAGAYRYIQAGFSSVVSSGSTYTDWILVGKTTGTPGNFPGIEVQSTIDSSVIIQTTTGTITQLSAGATWAIYDYSQDFWLVAATYVAGLTTSNIVLFPALSSNGTTASTAATGSAVFSLATTEAGSYPTSYVATGAASVTRNADVVTATTSGLLVNGQGFAAIGGRIIAQNGSGPWAMLACAAGEGWPLYFANSTLPSRLALYDGTSIINFGASTQIPAAGTAFKAATTWSGIVASGALNGTVGSPSSAFDSSLGLGTTIRIGDVPAGGFRISMVLQSMRLGVVRALNNNELGALTA